MLQIDIVGFSGDNLILEVDGKPNEGLCKCYMNEDVKWTIKEGCGVKSIQAIYMKTISGNNNIFSSVPPYALNGQKKQWQAKINDNAEDGDVFIYNIDWEKDGDSVIRTFDPIISIKPIRA